MSRYVAAILKNIGPASALAASAFCFWAWYDRYLRRDFNDLGRFYDAECQCVYTTSGFVWVLPACGFLLLAVLLLARRAWRSRAGKP